MKIIFDEQRQMQLVYDLGVKLELSDLQRVKMFRSYTIHGFEFRYTANGTLGYVYLNIGTNHFYVAESDYKNGEWFVVDVLEFQNGAKRITKKYVPCR